jgi:hypothetical protein
VSEIKPDSRNYRIHGEKSLCLPGKSPVDCNAGRSILIERDGCIDIAESMPKLEEGG